MCLSMVCVDGEEVAVLAPPPAVTSLDDDATGAHKQDGDTPKRCLQIVDGHWTRVSCNGADKADEVRDRHTHTHKHFHESFTHSLQATPETRRAGT